MEQRNFQFFIYNFDYLMKLPKLLKMDGRKRE